MFHRVPSVKRPAIKIVQQLERVGIVGAQTVRPVGGLFARHAQIAVRAEKPHRQFGEKLAFVGRRVSALPQTLGERRRILRPNLGAHRVRNAGDLECLWANS